MEISQGDIIDVDGREGLVLDSSPLSIQIQRLAKRETTEEFSNHVLVRFGDGEYGLIHEFSVDYN